MKSLAEIQAAFGTFVMRPLDSEAIPDGDIEAIVTPGEHLTSAERVGIYNRQYWYRLIDSLYDDFPGLRAVVGSDRFDGLVRQYLKVHPSRSFTLRNLGSKMPEFLAANPHWAGRRQRAALEMAQFEWAQMVAFDEVALPAIDPAAFNPATMTIRLQPYITLLSINYPLDDLVLELRREERERSMEASVERENDGEKVVQMKLPKPKPIYLAVHRYRNIIHYKRLQRGAYEILCALSRGESLNAACGHAVPFFKASDDPSSLIQRWFLEWGALSWLVDGNARVGDQQ